MADKSVASTEASASTAASMTSFVKSFGTFPYPLIYMCVPSLSFIESMSHAAAGKVPENITPVPTRAALMRASLKRSGTVGLVWCVGIVPLHAAFHFTAPEWPFKW